MSYTLPPLTLTQNQTAYVDIPGNLGAVSWVKMVNASPYLLSLNNLLGGQDYMQPGEANVWQVPGLTTAIQATPTLYGLSPSIIPSNVLVVTWYLEGEQPQGNYPVNFNSLNFLGNNVTTSVNTPNSLEQDVLTPFVLSGLTCTKDGSTANKLDMASGVALLRQSDQSLGRVAPAATSFTTVQVNSTYYLDLNPDGTLSWGLAHSNQSNYLSLAQVTTDASANIATVTDTRTTAATLLSTMAGLLTLPILNGYTTHSNAVYENGTATPPYDEMIDQVNNTQARWDLYNESARLVTSYRGGGGQVPISVNLSNQAVAFAGALSAVGNQATAGSFGVPVIVAQAIRTHVTATTNQTILSYTPGATGLYRVSGYVRYSNTSSSAPLAQINWTEPELNASFAANPAVSNSYIATGNQAMLIDGAVTIPASNTPLTFVPVTFEASAGYVITCTWQNPSGAPNDYVTFIIERME